MEMIDLSRKQFGRLLVVNLSGKNERGVNMWNCICDCGNIFVGRGDAIRNGHTKSCGCLARESQKKIGERTQGKISPRRKKLEGMRFGRLLVCEPVHKGGRLKWRCICDCGKETYTVTSKLTMGHTKSCGCLGLENATKAKIKHGDSPLDQRLRARLYRTWAAMKRRCYNKNLSSFKYYGGKGVTVCDEWRNDYQAFKDWAFANGYDDSLTIDRLDSNGNYDPDNCQWVTHAENIKRMHRTRGHKGGTL